MNVMQGKVRDRAIYIYIYVHTYIYEQEMYL